MDHYYDNGFGQRVLVIAVSGNLGLSVPREVVERLNDRTAFYVDDRRLRDARRDEIHEMLAESIRNARRWAKESCRPPPCSLADSTLPVLAPPPAEALGTRVPARRLAAPPP